MIRFESDYLEGAHPAILKALTDTNAEQTPGYSEDHYCEEARALIREQIGMPEAAVHFLVGGTQANRTVIAALLRAHQGVVAAETGHIACHETGAIENSGHKVLTLPPVNSKITGAQVEALCSAHYADHAFEHTVQPGMVYISNPTELGTVYTAAELTALHEVCQRYSMPLFVDGARLSCALECAECDYDLAGLARMCDVFYIGGTKLGLLFGEAVVFTVPALAKDFRYFIKQNGGMFAKGRLLGVQFLTLLSDGLYREIGRHEVELAMKLKRGLIGKGYRFLIDSPTNQQFPILPNSVAKALEGRFSSSFQQYVGEDECCVRFCTSWATTEADVDALLDAIPAK